MPNASKLMKKLLVLTGFIAVGKSTLLSHLKLFGIPCLSKDTIKEQLVAERGFKTGEDNKRLSQEAVVMMFKQLPDLFESDVLVAIEANFTHQELLNLKSLSQQIGCENHIILLTCQSSLAFKRYQERYPHLHKAHRGSGMIDELTFKEEMINYESMIKSDYHSTIDTTNSVDFNIELVKKIVGYK